MVWSVVTIGMRSSRSKASTCPQQLENVRTRLAAEDPVLVLHAHHVDAVDVQEIRRATVGRHVVLGYLEANARRVRVAPTGVVHRQHEAVQRRALERDRVAQVGRERGDAAVTRHVIAEHRDRANGSHVDDLQPSARECGTVRAVATPDDRYTVARLCARAP
jgi:hypothetical protein